MQHVFQSTFLQALGFAIANSLWQTALVWLLFMIVTNLLTLTASAKYRVAVTAQLISFTWFFVTFQFYYHQYSEAWQQSVAVSQNIQPIALIDGSFSSTLITWMIKGEQLLPYLSMAYLLLMVFLCIRWFLGYRQTQIIRTTGLEKIPADWRLFVKRIAAQLGIKKEIQVFLSAVVTTPMTIGFLKPIILIPVASINHLSTDQLEAVILHELAHIKRYDYLVNIVLSVVEISLFFNPFTQLLSKSIRKERENSCDDWVIQFQYNVSVYAEALLRIAYLQSAPSFAMAATGKKNELLTRVKRMIDKKENRFNYRKQLLAFVIVTGMLSSIAWLNPMAPAHKDYMATTGKRVEKRKIQPFAVEPIAISVSNPLFNPVFFLSAPLKAEMKKSMAAAQKEIEALTPAHPKENMGLMEAITPMVANALEQASVEMTEKNTDWKKELDKMEFAKMNLGKSFRMDSLSIPKIFRSPLKEEFTRSLKSMENDIANAKLEMSKAMKIKEDIHIDEEKIQRDIKQAMEEITKIGLDKLVYNALQIPGLLFEKDIQPKRIKPRVPPAPMNGERMKMRQPIPEKMKMPAEPPPAENSMSDDQPDNMTEASADIAPAVLAQLASLADMANSKDEQITFARIQHILKQLEKINVKPRAIPVVFKERGSEDKKEEKKTIIRLR